MIPKTGKMYFNRRTTNNKSIVSGNRRERDRKDDEVCVFDVLGERRKDTSDVRGEEFKGEIRTVRERA